MVVKIYLINDNNEFAGVDFVDEKDVTEQMVTIEPDFSKFPPLKWTGENWSYGEPPKSETIVDKTQQALGSLAKQVVDLSISKSTLTQADSVLAQQIVQLTDQNKKLQQAVATLAAQVVQGKGGN